MINSVQKSSYEDLKTRAVNYYFNLTTSTFLSSSRQQIIKKRTKNKMLPDKLPIDCQFYIQKQNKNKRNKKFFPSSTKFQNTQRILSSCISNSYSLIFKESITEIAIKFSI